MTTPELTKLRVDDDEMELGEWIQANSRWLMIGAAVIVVGGAGYWIYVQSQLQKEMNAAKALFTAKQSVQSGNAPLAQSDLNKLVVRYKGTSAGSEGAMLLAQMNYEQGKFQEGITALEDALQSAPQPLETSMRSLIGDGYLSMKNTASAAREFEKAAELTDREMERASQKAKAARAYMAGGDTAKARVIWTDLSSNLENPSVAAEARVRLGELTAKPARTG